MKKVLLIGDSIRLSYQPLVQEKLAGLAEVVGPDDNCRFAHYTLWNINNWIEAHGTPDIIHWNNGIWDVYRHNDDKGNATNLEYYMNDLERILHELEKTGAKIIWATTTPVNPKNEFVDNKDVKMYNDAAIKFMTSREIEINDLNKLVAENIDQYISDDNLHLSELGKAKCADAVVKKISKYLKTFL